MITIKATRDGYGRKAFYAVVTVPGLQDTTALYGTRREAREAGERSIEPLKVIAQNRKDAEAK